jgi:hypothetical protein
MSVGNIESDLLPLMIPILEIPGSDLGWETAYPDFLSSFHLFPSTKCHHSTLN